MADRRTPRPRVNRPGREGVADAANSHAGRSPFERQGLQPDDLIDFTPQLKAEALEIIKNYVTGPLYMPPSIRGDGPGDKKGTLQLPGSNGGVAWNRGSVRSGHRDAVHPVENEPVHGGSDQRQPEGTNLRYRAGSRALVAGPRGLPLTKPPYGRVTAINLNTGEHVWMVANGDGPRNHPELKALNLPPLGQAVRSTAIVTKTLLFVTKAIKNNPRTPPGGGRKFRALDKASGRTLWETEFESGATGAPMTYVHQGKQYVVLAIGGNQHPGEFVALSLP